MTNKLKIKKGDPVIIIAGKDKGKKGKIFRALPGERRVVVEGINIVKRRQRARKQGQKGQVIERPGPIAISNIMFYCAACGRGSRLGAKLVGENKLRVCRRCGKEI